MLHKFNSYKEELIIESVINESIVYYSPAMRDHLTSINDDEVAKKLLEIEGENLDHLDVTFIDVDHLGNLTFTTMKNAIKYLKDTSYYYANPDLVTDKGLADQLYKRTGLYSSISRNTIRIGKLVNKITRGKLNNQDIEKFVNKFKAKTIDSLEEIEIVSGKDIEYWW